MVEVVGSLSLEDLNVIVAPLAEEYGVDRVYLFGSRSRGDNRKDSDYDFYIRTTDKCGLYQLSGFLRKLKIALESDVDLVCEDSVADSFRSEITKDMRLVYES